MRFRAPPPGALVRAELDAFSALYHRPSGITHLLVAPAPEILDALAEPLTLAQLHARLAADFDLGGEADALAARVEELVAAGLVEAI